MFKHFAKQSMTEYFVAPETNGKWQVYSVVTRPYVDGSGVQTFRNSCGEFDTLEQAERVRGILQGSSQL